MSLEAPMASNDTLDTSGAATGAQQALRQASRWSLSTWWDLIKASLSAWLDDYAPSMGAALAYYTVFSLAPLLVIVVSLAGLVFGTEAVRGEVFGQIAGLMGPQAAQGVQDMLAAISDKPAGSALGAIVGVVVLLIGATTVFAELQDALDRIWRAPVRHKASGLWSLLRARLLSFGMILGIAFLLLVSLVAGAAISALGKWWGGWFEGWELVAQVVNVALGFALTTTVFALIYKVMPRVKVGWGDVWLGAAVTALLFTAAILGAFNLATASIIALVLAMGAVNNVFVKDGHVTGITYMTGTLVKIGQKLAHIFIGGGKMEWLPYALLWAGLVSGAVLGSTCFLALGLHSLWIGAAAAGLILGGLTVFRTHD